MNRRTFAVLLGCTMALPTRVAHAQGGGRLRRVAVLMLYEENDPAGLTRANAFRQQLEKLGWAGGRNVRIDFIWGIGDASWIRSRAEAILKTSPDIIVANGGASVRPVQSVTQDVPIIFIGGSDPVADGLVKSLSHPGGNVTGFTSLEPTIGAKLLGLLKEVAPATRHAAVMVNPDNPGALQLTQSAASAASPLGLDVKALNVRTPEEIERALASFAAAGDAGLVVPPDPSTNTHRKVIVELAAKLKLPTIYALRIATAEGGLMSYGIDVPSLFRNAASYADRILRGEKPANLPVQQPDKFEMAINLKVARSLGLNIPQSLLATADEVIQ